MDKRNKQANTTGFRFYSVVVMMGHVSRLKKVC